MANKSEAKETKSPNGERSARQEPLGEAASGGNLPAGQPLTSLDKRFHIYGDDKKTVIATTDNPHIAYASVAHGRKVEDRGKPYHGGAKIEKSMRGSADFNVVTIVALLVMFCASFTMLGAIARGQTNPPTANPPIAKTEMRYLELKIAEGQKVKVPAGNYTLREPLRLPPRSTLDLTGSRIMFTGRDWQPAINAYGAHSAKLIGGTFAVGKLNFVVDATNVSGFSMRNVRMLDGGGLIQGRGVTDLLVEDCVSEIVERNFIYFGDSPNKSVVIRRTKLIGGSRAESGIRIHKTSNLLIEGCDVAALLNKKTALRLHDGDNFTVKDSRFVGGVGVGPLTDGDGGRRLGIDQWVAVGGGTTTNIKNADLKATVALRQEKLALRATSVSFQDCVVEGSLVAKAGAEFEFTGGSIDPPKGQRIFEDTSERYPELDEWTLPGDVIRPAPVGQLIDVKLTMAGGTPAPPEHLNLPKLVSLSSKPFDVWLAWYNFQTTGQRQPFDFLWSYVRPVWMTEAGGRYGFWINSRWADLGPGISDPAAMSAAWSFAYAAPAPVVIDLEKFWPHGVAVPPEKNDWWYGGVGAVRDQKLAIAREKSIEAASLIDKVIAARPSDDIPVGAYLPNSIWDNGGETFQKVIVETFARPLASKLDFLVVEIYTHPNDTTPEVFEARARKVIAAYKPLGVPIRAIYYYSSRHTEKDRSGYLRAARRACEGIDGMILWDDITTPWSSSMARDFASIR